MSRSRLAILLTASMLAACSARQEDPPDAGSIIDAGEVETDAGIVEVDAGTDAGTNPNPQLSLAQFCTRAKQAVAERKVGCLGGPVEAWLAEDPDLCPYLQAAVSDGRIRYDPTHADACLALLDDMSCDSLGIGLTTADNACARTIEGLVAIEGDCRDDLDCQLGSRCDAHLYRCPGSCVPLIPVGENCEGMAGVQECVPGASCLRGTCTVLPGEGEPCHVEDNPCAPGLHCTENGTSEICVRNTAGPCRYNDDCAPGYQCEGEEPWAEPPVIGSCAPRKVGGAECEPGEQECEPFHFCDSETRVCTKYGDTGESCGTDVEYRGCIGSYCKELAVTEPEGEPYNVCTPYGHEGETCYWSSSDLECGAGGQCIFPADPEAENPVCFVGCRFQTVRPPLF